MKPQNTTQNTLKKGGNTTMYKLDYKEHIILKQAAFIIMQNHNKKQYQNKTRNYISIYR